MTGHIIGIKIIGSEPLTDLSDIIESNRISLSEFNAIHIPERYLSNLRFVKGAIAEQFVGKWLSACQGVDIDDDFIEVNGKNLRYCGKYTLVKTNLGIEVHALVDGIDRTLHEYDSLMIYDNRHYAVEVKSIGINHIDEKIDRGSAIAREIYGDDDIGTLIFFPIYGGREKDAERLREKFSEIECIDMGYSERELKQFLREFYLHTKAFKYMAKKID